MLKCSHRKLYGNQQKNMKVLLKAQQGKLDAVKSLLNK